MVRVIEIYGDAPHQYSEERVRNLRKTAFVQTYALQTGDSFEIGDGYSLHQTEAHAKKFITHPWWRRVNEPKKVFVSPKTLEEITKSEDKVIFRSWEN